MRAYWRALEERLESPEFQAELRYEFPAGADQLDHGMSRRSFMRLLGASMALAGVGGCFRRPREPILPYVHRPGDITPGQPLHYATAMLLGGYATGLLVESHEGRPTKIEGNPDHPASLGAAGVFQQASLLELYDPHRARQITRRRRRSSAAALGRLLDPSAIAKRAGARGAGLHLLLEPTSSPLIGQQLDRVRQRFPAAQVHWYAPLATRAQLDATAAAFGRAVQPIYQPAAADVIAAFEDDLFGAGPFQLRYARDFARGRQLTTVDGTMNRLYVAEGRPTVAGGIADHRLPVRPSRIPLLLAALLGQIRGDAAPSGVESLSEGERAWVGALASDLQAHRGSALVTAGETLPPAAQSLAHLVTTALDGVGRVVRYVDPQLLPDAVRPGLGELVSAMRQGQVETLIVLEGNPVYTAPADLDFAAALAKVPNSVHLGLFSNETGSATTWQVPAAHYLESWGDGRALDGTASLVQPLIAPLYDGITGAQLLAMIAGDQSPDSHRMLQDSWRNAAGSDFTAFWNEAVQKGVIPGTAASPVAVAPRWNAAAGTTPSPTEAAGDVDLIFAADSSVYDGRFGDNPWLQELPDPLSKLTWDNAALLSPATASRIGVENEQMIEIASNGRRMTLPALVLPGHADDSVTVSLGYGRRAPDEPVAKGAGFDGYRLRTSQAPYVAPAQLRVATGRYPLALTQAHWAMEGRPIVLAATLDELRRNPDFTREEKGPVLSLYQPFVYRGEQWGMVIDLGLCTGCSACVVACQAENNIPVVGKEGVQDSREMHWLRIDRYYSGDPAVPGMLTQPMLCQHCEKAPCEYVCPVNATVHSPDGINEMIYNRCVGTRFCSNNCPYKVRRFNWFDYNAEVSETEAMAKNPDVTVRSRGVMEKCTFCIQRVREAQIAAAVEGRALGSNEVHTACQQACPTEAIVFGSLGDPKSAVSRRLNNPRAYQVLHELGTRPRVHYLARIRNANAALEPPDGG